MPWFNICVHNKDRDLEIFHKILIFSNLENIQHQILPSISNKIQKSKRVNKFSIHKKQVSKKFQTLKRNFIRPQIRENSQAVSIN